MNRNRQLELYQDFIINCTNNAKSVKNYSDFKRINECLNILFPEQQDISILDFDDPVEFEGVMNKLFAQKQFIDFDNAGKNQYSNTLKHYLKFLYAKKMFSQYPILDIFNDGLRDTYSIEELKNILINYWKRKHNGNQYTPFISFGFEFGNSIIKDKINYKKFISNAGIITKNADYYLGIGVDLYKATYNKIYGIRFGEARTYGNYINKKRPLQQIFYGAPGTGKSHEIKRLTEGHSVIRTTFHPDSDYSTFVGAYKPTMEISEVRVVPVVVNNDISLDQNNGTYKENKIVYKFVKQAFLKAYLAAWKKMANASFTSNANSFTVGGNTFTITAVDDDKVTYSSSFSLTKNAVHNTWEKLWNNKGSFKIPTGKQSGVSSEQAVCKWIHDNNFTKNSFDAGWDNLKNELAIRSIDVDTGKGKADSEPKQIYTLSLGVNNDNILVTTNDNQKDKTRIKDCYSGDSKPVGVEKGLVDNLKELDPDSFEGAWEKLKNKTNDTIVTIEPQFLIIEEINRGNCAQIFGDLFQLLDRNKYDYSEYPIVADDDLKKVLAEEFKNLNLDALKQEIDAIFKENYPNGITDKILNGELLVLPKNLYIWATMNTSDQSLFPIDSAFKRRWEWKYMPIGYKNEDWTIKIGEKKYKWVDFQRIINDKIYSVDNSEDKQLGDFFVDANRTGKEVSADTLLNKILFYIWNDVCKDDPDQIFRWIDYKDNKEKSIRFSDFFDNDKDKKLQGLMCFLEVNAIGESKETNETEPSLTTEESETSESLAEKDDEVTP